MTVIKVFSTLYVVKKWELGSYDCNQVMTLSDMTVSRAHCTHISSTEQTQKNDDKSFIGTM